MRAPEAAVELLVITALAAWLIVLTSWLAELDAHVHAAEQTELDGGAP